MAIQNGHSIYTAHPRLTAPWYMLATPERESSKMRTVTNDLIGKFRENLENEEKSLLTIEKYVRDITVFLRWLTTCELDKTAVLRYKEHLTSSYSPASVNSMLSSLNSFFAFNEWHELKVKALKIQRQIFADKEGELTKTEYERLLRAAKSKGNERLCLLMQTICGCGLRVSELKFVTVEALKKRRAEIKCKGKIRQVFIPEELCRLLERYAKQRNIKSGAVFVSKTGKPLNRSNIWTDMKKLCERADVSPEKVFPHNLRHLFARTFYTVQKDIVRLADVLGHSSINTTRIYTMETGEQHQKLIQKLGLVVRLC